MLSSSTQTRKMKKAEVYTTVLILYVFTCQCSAVIPSHLSQPTLQTMLIGGTSSALKIDHFLHDNDSCPSICKCRSYESHTEVECIVRNLTTLATLPTYTTALTLSRTRLRTLNISFQGLSHLQKLILSHNELKYVNWKFHNFFTKLKLLDLSHNLLYGTLSSNSLHLFESLELLNISYNQLNELPHSLFNKLKSLKLLDLSNNKILEIDLHSFSKLYSLEILDLSVNNLYQVQHDWFSDLKNLKELRLGSNHIQNLSNVVFSALNTLQYLDLSDNKIMSIGMLSFKGLKELRKLNLSMNNISFLQETTLKPLSNLEVLDLSFNLLATLDNLFSSSICLKKLFLSNIKSLSRITKPMFNGLLNLEELQIANSSLSSIAKDAFVPLTKMKVLDIMGSNMITLEKGVFDTLSILQRLNLAGNPWHCDCYMYWLLPWLGDHTNAHLLNPFKTLCFNPSPLAGHTLLDALDKNMVCTNTTVQKNVYKIQYRVGSSAILNCQAEGSPTPNLTWITPQNEVFHWSAVYENTTKFLLTSSPKRTYNVWADSFNHSKDDQFLLLKNGSLFISKIQRMDGGHFRCIASNPLSKEVVNIHVSLDYEFLGNIKIISILVGFALSFGFLLVTLMVILIQFILKRFGIECPCPCGIAYSTKAQHIKRMLENMEGYRRQQLDRLRDHYSVQVQRIKNNCIQQMEKLREGYSLQTERIRDICDYGTQHIDRIRDNYYQQVQRVRDYSTGQIDRLRENYVFQRNRIRKFSAHQLYKLRENYKVQQQHLNKILENLNLESCRNVCARTDSIMFEPEILVEPVFVPAINNVALAQLQYCSQKDQGDNSSQTSAYFTPDETGSQVSDQNDFICSALPEEVHQVQSNGSASSSPLSIVSNNLSITATMETANTPANSQATLTNERISIFVGKQTADACKAEKDRKKTIISLTPGTRLHRSRSLPETRV
ncbi:leucine-rich repeat neuronal protein 1-like [Limulus polyphemus]|uniref:Leucine-rich repeat neuronal protein 1-like n=1 Tax=Limulus polyphemus TaxID=6850 RepID=A0ABM1B5N3_LIMPO|nr:leucine-rich repeat neuronal protein 1-like [Limulus polyphemus]